MEVAIHSPLGIGATLEKFGFEIGFAQLSSGPLHGVVRLGGSNQLPVLSIQTNQDLVLHGNGFQSRNHFARDYRSQFGESPSATLQRASAPGISVQSVSVAQSPQMAMALR